MVICVAGKNNISVDVLDYLYQNNNQRYQLCIVCNRNEKGENSWQRSLRFYAEQKGIRECKLEELYDIEELIFLSMEFDTIITPNAFKSHRLYNVHFSLLPQYKGMYTSAVPILNGEQYVGVTVHRIDSGIDTGDIIDQVKFELEEEWTSRDLYLQYIKRGTELVINNLEDIIQEKDKAYPQASANATYYSKKYIDYSNVTIDLRQTAEGIKRQIRAFAFREYQMPSVLGHAIISARITNIKSNVKPGTVIYSNEHGVMLGTIDYNIFLYYDRLDELLKACEQGELGKVMEICAAKEHINAVNEKGWSPLIIATYNNRMEVVKYLISVGADISVRNNNGTNLLMYAKDAYLQYGLMDMVLLFLKLGLDCRLRDYADKDLRDYIREMQMTEEQRCSLIKVLG